MVIPHTGSTASGEVEVGAGTAPGEGRRFWIGLELAPTAPGRAVADTIIPRTDTPSATDVGVHGFVNVIVAEYAKDDDRTTLLAGLDAPVRAATDAAFHVVNKKELAQLIESLDRLRQSVQRITKKESHS